MDHETKTAFAEVRQHMTEQIAAARQHTDDTVAAAVTAAVAEMRREIAASAAETRKHTDDRFETALEAIRRQGVELKQAILDTRHETSIRFERMEHKIDFLVEAFQMNTDKINDVDEKHDAKAEALDLRVTRLEASNARRRR